MAAISLDLIKTNQNVVYHIASKAQNVISFKNIGQHVKFFKTVRVVTVKFHLFVAPEIVKKWFIHLRI